MPSSEKTQYLGLNQWAGSDIPATREDLNADNQKIDDGVKAVSDKIAGQDATIALALDRANEAKGLADTANEKADSLKTSVDELYVQTADTLVVANKAFSKGRESLVKYGGKAVFIGDSYAVGTGASSQAKAWAGQVAERMGFDATIVAQSGAGFVYAANNRNFLSMLDEAKVTVGEAYENVDFVIVAGGLNDANRKSTGVGAAVLSWVKKARELFPNAVPVVVPMLWPTNRAAINFDFTNRNMYLDMMTNAANGGAVVIKNAPTWCWGVTNASYTDNFHLTDAGYNIVARYICDGLMGNPTTVNQYINATKVLTEAFSTDYCNCQIVDGMVMIDFYYKLSTPTTIARNAATIYRFDREFYKPVAQSSLANRYWCQTVTDSTVSARYQSLALHGLQGADLNLYWYDGANHTFDESFGTMTFPLMG